MYKNTNTENAFHICMYVFNHKSKQESLKLNYFNLYSTKPDGILICIQQLYQQRSIRATVICMLPAVLVMGDNIEIFIQFLYLLPYKLQTECYSFPSVSSLAPITASKLSFPSPSCTGGGIWFKNSFSIL